MSEPFLGEIMLVGFNFAPRGWALCNGQLLAINQNTALFSLLGTMYGGNGQTTFALPDLRGRVAMHFGAGFTQGQVGGEETHTLSVAEMPTHNHSVQASAQNAETPIPAGGRLAAFDGGYGPATELVSLAPATVANAGANAAHPNMAPYRAVNYIIALQGIFPSRN